MARYHEVFEEIQELFDARIAAIDNFNEINIKVIGCNTLKEVASIKKASPTEKYKTQDDLNIYLNELIFEQLSDEGKEIVIEELLAAYHVDDNGNLKPSKPDVTAGYSLIIMKHGIENYIQTKLLIKELFSQRDQEDAENGANDE